MKPWIKASLCVLLSFMCLFTCVGYAAVTGDLLIFGSTEAKPPKTLFIKSVTSSSTLGGSAAVNSFVDTTVNSDVQLGNDANSTVTLHVTVFNNTIDNYIFKDIAYIVGEDTYDNTNIVFDVNVNLGDDNRLVPNEHGYIDITFSYNRYSGVPEDLTSVLELHFHLSGDEGGTDYEQYILIFMNNDKGYGLNDGGQKSQAVYNQLKAGGLLYADDHFTQGNLGQLLKALDTTDTKGLTFVYEFIDETEINLYTYEDNYNSSTYNEQPVTVYKTNFKRKINADTGEFEEWIPTNSRPIHGTATVKRLSRGNRTFYAIDVGSWTRTLTIAE